MIVQATHTRGNAAIPAQQFRSRQSIRISIDDIFQTFAAHEFHDDPGLPFIVIANVVNRD
jgi:hypothetical protein